jgi:hypothetical protein
VSARSSPPGALMIPPPCGVPTRIPRGVLQAVFSRPTATLLATTPSRSAARVPMEVRRAVPAAGNPPQLSGTPNMTRRGPMPVARVTGHIRTTPLFSSTVSLSAARVPLSDRPAARALAGSPILPPWPQSP